MYDAVKAELMLRGAYFLKDEEEKDKVGAIAGCSLGCCLGRAPACDLLWSLLGAAVTWGNGPAALGYGTDRRNPAHPLRLC